MFGSADRAASGLGYANAMSYAFAAVVIVAITLLQAGEVQL
jgi:hypothetical protein